MMLCTGIFVTTMMCYFYRRVFCFLRIYDVTKVANERGKRRTGEEQ